MYLNIHALEIADGLKYALIHADFTIQSILKHGPGEIASIMGIELYVAEIIFNAAKKAVRSNGSAQNYYHNDNTKSFELIDKLRT
jgi:3-methyladenine DNA glycosylase Mpg